VLVDKTPILILPPEALVPDERIVLVGTFNIQPIIIVGVPVGTPKPKPVKDPNTLLSIPDAAEYLGIGPEALRRMCRRKKITFIKVGSGHRFTRAQLEEYVASRTNKRKSTVR
jgi:excisionase family DNA binding protein